MISAFVLHTGVIAATFVVAGFVKGVTGMGLPTVAMGIPGTLMLPAQVAALLLLPSFVTNVWRLFAGPGVRALAQRLWALAGLGAALTLYAAAGLLAWRLPVPARHERWLAPAIGVLTGAVSGSTGLFVVPAVPYLQGLALKQEDLVQALGLSFTVSTLALAIGLVREHAFALNDLRASVAAVIPALAGIAIGQRVRSRIGAQSLRNRFDAGSFSVCWHWAFN